MIDPCPGCGSTDIKNRGRIPRSNSFAGLPAPDMPGRLAECRSCGLGFRSPQPSPELLARLYRAGSGTAWITPDQERPDWRLAAAHIAAIGPASVLDVGCFDGAFFDLVEGNVQRRGVEINDDAVSRARQRGVELVARDLRELAGTPPIHDCIVAFDVIEHVHDPATFVAQLVSVLRPGGHLILATGEFAAPTHRLMGSKYLYSWYQEHIAFIGRKWVMDNAPSWGMDVVELTRFSHHPQGRRGFLRGLVKNAIYRAAWPLIDRLRNRTGVTMTGPPVWPSARDHFVVLLRKAV